MTSPYRSLPSVDRFLSDERILSLVTSYSREAVLDLVKAQLDDTRRAITSGAEAPALDELVDAIEARASAQWSPWPAPIINATGVILHTNLGRAPLSHEATEAARLAATGYSDLELDLHTGRRGSRQAYIGSLLCQLTGAEAAIVVNNNAAAILLGLAAIAAGKEVIVSRGEAIEIGGGFRIPDVLRQSGAILVEVGTTNRTYVRDFEAAITEDTGAFLSAHASNFRVTGFTHSPELSELVEAGRQRGIIVLHDLGSGCLLDTSRYGLAHEPTPQESVRAGAGLAFFSGDKLLGGPQAGIVVGKQHLIDVVSKHPLARAVRIDKLSIAALSATLLHYIKQEAEEKVPVWRMIAMPLSRLEATSRRWSEALGPRASVADSLSTIGGGSLPGETLPSRVVSIDTTGYRGGAEVLAQRLREGRPPIVGRIEDERILIDPRTVLPEDEEALLRGVRQALS